MNQPSDEDVDWVEEDSTLYSAGTLLSMGAGIRTIGWILTFVGIGALFLSIGRYVDIQSFDFLAALLVQCGLVLVVSGVTWIVLGHLIGCFVAIERNTRR